MKRLAALLLVGCGAAVPPVPSKGGPAWVELTSEHFTLWTDSDRGRELIRAMEDLRQVVIGIGFRGASGAGRSFVIALRDDDEVGAFMPGDFAAIASPASSYIHQPMILLAAESSRDPKRFIAAHELTHTISQAVIRKQPRWFAEGLAKYFETIEIDRSAGTVDLGRAPTHKGQPMMITRLMPLWKMFQCDDLNCADPHFYASAWALFTYLTNVRPAELAKYEQLLAVGASHQQAWQDAFGKISLDQLEADMKHWLVEGSHSILHYKVQLRDWPVTERKLGDADVYAARALLRLQFQERRDLAKAQVEAAIAVEPTNVLARAVGYAIDLTIDEGTARALVKAHPDDWRAWWLLAAASKQGDEAKEAQLTACELIAKNPAIVPPWRPCPTR